MAGAVPVLGFREWTVGADGLVSSVRGERWLAAVMQASCQSDHPAPAADCSCGIYAVDRWPRLGDPRLYEQATAPLRLVAVFLLTAVVLAGLLVLVAMDRTLVARRLWSAAAIVTLSMLIGLLGVAKADLWIAHAPKPYLLGAVAMTGRLLRHSNGVLRGERARIVCLIRPPGVDRALAGRVARSLGVPCFPWWQRKRVLRYLSEHGDLWSTEPAPARRPVSDA
jgi:hypothetical protein